MNDVAAVSYVVGYEVEEGAIFDYARVVVAVVDCLLENGDIPT